MSAWDESKHDFHAVRVSLLPYKQGCSFFGFFFFSFKNVVKGGTAFCHTVNKRAIRLRKTLWQNKNFFLFSKSLRVWKTLLKQARQWFKAAAVREEYIFSVCVVGNLFTGRVAHLEHMLLHVHSES